MSRKVNNYARCEERNNLKLKWAVAQKAGAVRVDELLQDE